MTTMTSDQLTLGLSLSDEATFSNFYVGDNELVVAALKACLLGEGEWFIFLWGSEGVGRSHLLQACCHEINIDRSAVYIDFNELINFSPEILMGLENIDLVCLDNIEAVLNNQSWEESLFHFYNRLSNNRLSKKKMRLIIASKTSSTQLSCQLADLRSRFSSGLCFQVKGLNDIEKCAALVMRAKHRGMVFPDASVQYLLHHASRDLAELIKILDILEDATLIEQRRITVPFLKSVLNRHS